MKLARSRQRSLVAPVARTLLVATLAFTVIWQVTGRGVHESVQGAASPASGEILHLRPAITTAEVNLRSGPGTSHEVISVLPVQTVIAATGRQQDGFAEVQVDGQRAWLSVDYIEINGPTFAKSTDVPVETALPELTEVVNRTIIAPPIDAAPPAPDDPVDRAEVPGQLTNGRKLEGIQAEQDDTHEEDILVGERWVEVDRSTATVMLHEGETVVAVFQGKIGKDATVDGYYSTAVGTFHVYSMNRHLTETPFAPGVYLTDWVGFDPNRSNGFHSPVRDAEGNVVATGGTTTLGCVRLGEQEARQMFEFAFIGMRVEIHD